MSVVADEILRQLGGQKFIAMTGASSFAGSKNSLSFKLPGKAGFVRNGIRGVLITLDASDTYTVEFGKVTKRPRMEYVVIAKHTGVYCDNLREVFTAETGLDTSL